MRMALILWDIDHTLIENGGVSKETYSLAFQILTGVAPAAQPETDGRTDFEIMANLFLANGRESGEYSDTQVFDALVTAMERNSIALASRGHALPGAFQALQALSTEGAIAQSVLTGNIEPNARAKLSPFHLDDFLDFGVGGFGSDHIERAKLVGVAQRKASVKFHETFGEDDTLLVGDTPRDVDAGLRGGAKVLGVATGKSSFEELEQAGAHSVLPDLTDTSCLTSKVSDLLGVPLRESVGQSPMDMTVPRFARSSLRKY